MKKTLLTFGLIFSTTLISLPRLAESHCQVPCGIYDDHARIHAMLEDGATVVKAVNEMAALSGKTDPQSYNQLVRWIMNKESHAESVIQTISNYFLTQRIKPDQEDYAERLQKHHAVVLAAMKAKQSSSVEAAEALVNAIEMISPYYPEAK